MTCATPCLAPGPAAVARRPARGVAAGARVHVAAREAAGRQAPATLLRLATATRERRRVTIEYRSWRGASSERRLDPYGVVFHSGRWYVTGHDHHRDGIRTFRLDRIASVARTETGFAVPDGFDPVAHVTRSLAAVPYTWQVEVLLETDPAQARRRIPATMARRVRHAPN